MSEKVFVEGRAGEFQIVGRGRNNHRVAPVGGNGESFLVPVADIRPIEEGPGRQPMSMENAFSVLEDFVGVVAANAANGLFLVGPGGLGKTVTVMDKVKEMGLVQGEDYVVVKGYTSPVGLYNTLHDNRDKLVIFDDCDSVFKDVQGLNILKAVLDTLPERRVSWSSASTAVAAPFFDFTGRIIFISNLDPEKTKNGHFKAVLTRVLTLTVGGTRKDVLYRMNQLLEPIATAQGVGEVQAREVMDFLVDHENHWDELNLRTLVHVLGLRKYCHEHDRGDAWKSMAKAMN